MYPPRTYTCFFFYPLAFRGAAPSVQHILANLCLLQREYEWGSKRAVRPRDITPLVYMLRAERRRWDVVSVCI